MSNRDALLEAFLSSASERLVRMGESIATMAESQDPELLRMLGRDFHTLKGESRLVAIEPIEHLAHAAEDVLYGHARAGRFGSETQEYLYEAIDTIFECIQSLKANREIPKDAIDDVISRMRQAVVTASPTDESASREPAEQSVFGAPSVVSEPEVSVQEIEAGLAATAQGLGSAPAGGGTLDASGGRLADQTVQVASTALDRIGELVASVSGGLVRSREYLSELSALHDELGGRLRENGLDAKAAAAFAGLYRSFGDVIRRFGEDLFSTGLIDAELSEAVRTSRLRPLRHVFSNYPTFVRRVASDQGKKISLSMSGLEVRVEQRVADEIAEPCLHLLRNAIVHGIESQQERHDAGKPEAGIISLCATQEGDMIRVELSDDGRGMDVERVGRRAVAMGLVAESALRDLTAEQIFELAFQPGLSTAAELTELAGRGVGLDVVREAFDRLSGSIKLLSKPGRGCRFVLTLPVSVSIVRVLLVDASEQVFAIPNAAVVEVYWLPVKEIRSEGGHESTFYRGHLLPLVRLREALGMRGIKDLFVNKVVVVVIRSGDQMAGFVVDRCLGEREVVARHFGFFLGRPETTSGVTVLEDGSLIVLLHPGDLVRTTRREYGRALGPAAAVAERTFERRILYAEDSLITREYAASVLRAHGFEVVEVGDGVEAMEQLSQKTFDLLLTDLQMPHMDGFKLTAAVRREARYRNLPIVVLSTVDVPETKRMALQAGADAYIVKSQFGVDVLISTIRQVLG